MHRTVALALPQIASLCAQLGVRRLDLFGSAAADDPDTEPADIDILVELG